MGKNYIIDRRKNPGGKNSVNRQKFVQRAKKQIQQSIKRRLGDRDISDSTSGQNVKVNRRGISEPEFQHDHQTGDSDRVLPGNKEYVEGDQIPVPSGGGQGKGDQASDNGDGEDDFDFAISNDEFVDLLFEDLELPHMTKKEHKSMESFERQRAGYSNEGNPAQLNLVQSMRNSIGRRIALKKPKSKKIKELEELLATLKPSTKRYREVEEELRKLRRRHSAIPFLDPTDLRYNNYTNIPKPTSQAVIFFVMDVSGSMSQHHKDLAKRFFMLMNLFVSRKYKRTDVVFIRHHHEAEEVDEDDFFYKRESGGTVVSSAFELMMDIQRDRYPVDQWNIYVAQATDGDNYTSDNQRLQGILEDDILPIVQYLSYILVCEDTASNQYAKAFGASYTRDEKLTRMMQKLEEQYDNMVVKSVTTQSEVYPIFREIFKKR